MPLLLHVGLPKTGTTTLQALFQHLPKDYVFAPSGPNNSNHSFWTMDLATQMSSMGESIRRFIQSEEVTFVVSAEVLTVPYRCWSHIPPQDRIRRVLELLDPTRNNTRIVCGVRPQADWLASYFAQTGTYANFPAFVKSWLKQPIGDLNDILNFDSLDHQLSSLVGADNVGFLPLHEFGLPNYWKQLTDGTTLAPDFFAALFATQPQPQNVNKRGQTWTTSGGLSLRGRIAHNLPSNSIGHQFLTSKWNLPLRAVTPISKSRPQSFQISEMLERQISERYRDLNVKFETRRRLSVAV